MTIARGKANRKDTRGRSKHARYDFAWKTQQFDVKRERVARRLEELAAAHDAHFAILTVDAKWAVILHSFAPLSRAHVANQYAGRGFIARSIRQLSGMVDRILEPPRQLPPTFPAIFVIFRHPGVIPPHRPIRRLQRRFPHSLDGTSGTSSSKSFPRSTPFVGPSSSFHPSIHLFRYVLQSHTCCTHHLLIHYPIIRPFIHLSPAIHLFTHSIYLSSIQPFNCQLSIHHLSICLSFLNVSNTH